MDSLFWKDCSASQGDRGWEGGAWESDGTGRRRSDRHLNNGEDTQALTHTACSLQALVTEHFGPLRHSPALPAGCCCLPGQGVQGAGAEQVPSPLGVPGASGG